MAYLDEPGLKAFWKKIKDWTRVHHGQSLKKGTATEAGIPLDLMNGADSPAALGDTVIITKDDITALGIPGSDTKYAVATQSDNGLMSSADKKKLDGVEANANHYVHPTSAAGAKASGLYKVATDAQGHVTGATAVTKSDITALGIPGSKPIVTDEKVKTVPALDGTKFYLAGTENANGEIGTLDISKQVYVKSVGANTNTLVSEQGIEVGDRLMSLKIYQDGLAFGDGTILTSNEYDGNAATANSASSVQWAGVKNVPSASTTTAGIVKLGTTAGTAAEGNHTHATKADLASPTFTGTPKAPTAAAGTNTTQIATTAFVQSAVVAASTGTAKHMGAMTPAKYTALTTYKKGWYWVVTQAGTIAGEACEVGDMVFCNTSTPTSGTKLDSYFNVVQNNIPDLATIRSGAAKGATALQSVPSTYRTAAQQDAIHDATKANVASPTFTGTPKAPTAAAGTNTTQIATTAFVQSAVASASPGASTVVADYVVAQGKCDFWTWRMWKSGVAECWGSTGETYENVTSEWGSLYEGSAHSNGFPGNTSESSALAFSVKLDGVTYKRLFKNVPEFCSCSFNPTGGTGISGIEIGGGLSAMKTPTVYLLRPTSARVDGHYSYYAKGRWK